MSQPSLLGLVSHRPAQLAIIGMLLVWCISSPMELASQAERDDEIATIIRRGEELNNSGKYTEAIVEFQKAIDIDAHSSYALFRMAEAQFKLGELRMAMNALQQAVAGDLRPKWIEVWSFVNMGRILDIRGQRQRDRALTAYRKAIDTADDSFGAQDEAKKYLKQPFEGRTLSWPSS
jgi:tetratricopeptide (TPR) repeat protein